MAEQLRVDIESDIKANDIRDANGLKQFHSTLMNIAIFQEDYPEARRQIELVRGAGSPNKVFAVSGCSKQEAQRLIEEAS